MPENPQEKSSKNDAFLNLVGMMLSDVLNRRAYWGKFDNERMARLLERSDLSQTHPEAYQNLINLCGRKMAWGPKVLLVEPNPAIENNSQFLIKAANEFLKTSPEASGQLIWHVWDKVYLRESVLNLSQEELYKRRDEFKKTQVRFLNSLDLKPDAYSKVNVLDLLLSYKASDKSGVYAEFIRQMADYNVADNPARQEFAAKQTVKILFKALDKSRSSNGAAKLQLFLPIFENAAKNGFYIDNITYVDVSGDLGEKNKTYTLDKDVKLDILKRLQRSKLPLSARCISYFKSEPISAESVINKIENVQDMLKNSRRTWERRLKIMDKIHPLIEGVVDNALVMPSRRLITTYAGYLSEYAALHPTDDNVSEKPLLRLLQKNAALSGLNSVQERLFGDAPLQPAKINKALVADVADIYAQNVASTHPEIGEFNPYLHQKMTRMFSYIVNSYDYSKEDVDDLCSRLAKGGGNAPEFKRAAQMVMAAYTNPNRKVMAIRSRSASRS